MSWREELRQTPLSFRGVRIIWNNTSESGGYNNDKKIYPSMGGWDIEQISQIPESFSIEGKLLGEDYLDKKNKLRSALQTPGPGPLVIPGLGTVQVLVAKWSIKEKVDAKGMAEVSMSFDKAQPEKIKFVQVDPAVVITDHSPVLAENLTGYMESRMNYDSASLLLEARRATAAVFDEILTAAAMLQGQTGPLAKVLNTIKNARDPLKTCMLPGKKPLRVQKPFRPMNIPSIWTAGFSICRKNWEMVLTVPAVTGIFLLPTPSCTEYP